MTTEIDLLPMPKPEGSGLYRAWSYDQMRDYARANVARNTALLRAEIEALRTEAEQHLRQAMSNGAKARAAKAQADNLRTEIEALRKLLDRMVVCNPDGSVGIRVTEDALNAAAELYRLFGDAKKEAGND